VLPNPAVQTGPGLTHNCFVSSCKTPEISFDGESKSSLSRKLRKHLLAHSPEELEAYGINRFLLNEDMMLFKNCGLSQCHELGWSMSGRIFQDSLERLEGEHALILEELWRALGGAHLLRDEEPSSHVEANTGACSGEESWEDSMSQGTLFDEPAEDRESEIANEAMSHDDFETINLKKEKFDVRTTLGKMVQENETNSDVYKPYIFATLFPDLLKPEELAKHQDEFMRDADNVLWRRVILTKTFETDLG